MRTGLNCRDGLGLKRGRRAEEICRCRPDARRRRGTERRIGPISLPWDNTHYHMLKSTLTDVESQEAYCTEGFEK